jgi:hypothetical protein
MDDDDRLAERVLEPDAQTWEGLRTRRCDSCFGNDFKARYACLTNGNCGIIAFIVLGFVLGLGLTILWLIAALATPSTCDGGYMPARPCMAEDTLGTTVVVTGGVKTIPCGKDCDDCLDGWHNDVEWLGGNTSVGYVTPEAYYIHVDVRDIDDHELDCGLTGSDWACVEVCRSTLVDPLDEVNWELSDCAGKCGSMWVSRETCVVLTAHVEELDMCNGPTDHVDIEYRCESTGAPVSTDVGAWFEWDKGWKGKDFILYEQECIATDCKEEGCKGNCKEHECERDEEVIHHQVSKSSGSRVSKRSDLEPYWVSSKTVNWIQLPPDDYTWLRFRRDTDNPTAALRITLTSGETHITPYAPSFNGDELP